MRHAIRSTGIIEIIALALLTGIATSHANKVTAITYTAICSISAAPLSCPATASVNIADTAKSTHDMNAYSGFPATRYIRGSVINVPEFLSR